MTRLFHKNPMSSVWGIVVVAVLGVALAGWIAPINDAEGRDVFRFLGRFHVLILHFPIVLIFLAPLLELIGRFEGARALSKAAPFIWVAAAITAVVTVVLGLTLAASEGYAAETVEHHRFGGVLLAILVLVIAGLKVSYALQPRAVYSIASFLLVPASLGVLFFAAHAGGNLVRGEEYLVAYAPPIVQKLANYSDPAKNLDWDEETDPFFTAEVQPLLQNYCFDCHGADMQKGNMRLDVLNPDMVAGHDAEAWHEALNALNIEEMPPKKELQPTKEEREKIVDWLTEELQFAAKMKKGEDTPALQRLTKAQYSNTLQDLLGVEVDFAKALPNDGKSELGFRNNGHVLQTTQLHLSYFQEIARIALDTAIGAQEKPDPLHFRVTFGRGVDPMEEGGFLKAFQSQSIPQSDFKIEFIDEDGQPTSYNSDEKRAREAAQKKFISVDMRGSDGQRYQMTDDGMVLYSALPHKEVAPKSWQGPSPNLLLQVQRLFPTRGDFQLRVRASKGSFTREDREYFVRAGKTQFTTISEETKGVVNVANGLHFKPEDAADSKGMKIDNGVMLSTDLSAADHWAKFKADIPKTGFYQVELVHPRVKEGDTLAVKVDLERNLSLEDRLYYVASAPEGLPFVSPIGIAYLEAGEREIQVGGRFFVGMQQFSLVPLDESEMIVQQLQIGGKRDKERYNEATPWARFIVGTQTDDGMDYKEFDDAVEVREGFGGEQEIILSGRMENFPIPNLVEGDDDELGGILLLGVWNDFLVKEFDHSGPPLLIKSIEFEGPFVSEWPTKSYSSIFFDSPNRNNEEEYTFEVLERFITRAYRRPVEKGELDKFFRFWKDGREDFDRYEDSVKEVLVAVLSSPNFLFMAPPKISDEPKDSDKNGRSDDYAIASRLSYFLWDTAPDDELLSLAEQEKLAEAIPSQVGRMLADERAEKFIRSFAYDWLRVDRHENMTIDADEFPAYSRFVKRDMELETYAFLKEVIASNLSIFTFIDSDFAMLNQNLAEFYGVNDVTGSYFRPVAISPEQKRGGLLAQGAFLSGHSDGVHPHPIKRAVWIMEKILGDEPPAPPPNVPALDPETPGFENLTLKQQLELHRDKDACRSCHQKIDPYGVVFEEFSAVGLHQDMAKGRPVDVRSTLPDGTSINGVDELKSYILADRRDEFGMALIRYLYAYALGRDISFADQQELEEILQEVKSQDYTMQSVFTAIATSDSFLGKVH